MTLIFYVGSSSQLTHMFQCVKKVPANMHRELSKKGYVWMVLEENWWSHSKGIFHLMKNSSLSFHFLWKIKDQRKSFRREFSFKYNKDIFFTVIICFSFFPYALLFIHQICTMWQTLCHNYSNKSQHLYTLYYAIEQDRCSMPIYSHKKTVRGVFIFYTWGDLEHMRF